MRQTTADNLQDLVTELGGTPASDTKADLIDQLEGLVGGGGADIVPGSITAEDMDEIFNGS